MKSRPILRRLGNCGDHGSGRKRLLHQFEHGFSYRSQGLPHPDRGNTATGYAGGRGPALDGQLFTDNLPACEGGPLFACQAGLPLIRRAISTSLTADRGQSRLCRREPQGGFPPGARPLYQPATVPHAAVRRAHDAERSDAIGSRAGVRNRLLVKRASRTS
jgi:hypothetical protein